jgi:hypothetical protein
MRTEHADRSSGGRTGSQIGNFKIKMALRALDQVTQ